MSCAAVIGWWVGVHLVFDDPSRFQGVSCDGNPVLFLRVPGSSQPLSYVPIATLLGPPQQLCRPVDRSFAYRTLVPDVAEREVMRVTMGFLMGCGTNNGSN